MTERGQPRVSVITATYNGTPFLSTAIESVLAQSFEDFEYLVVDDASTDESAEIVAAMARRDRRVRLIRVNVNLGPAGALNRAMALVRGEYVAVLDHDDLALPERLARQVDFLDSHAEVGAVGAQVRTIDSAGIPIECWHYPTHPAGARWELLFGASLLHSASMFRHALLVRLGGYSERHSYLCDYEQLVRLAEVSQVTNLPEELACYRESTTQVSAGHRRRQYGQALLLQYAVQRRWLGLRPDLGVFATLYHWGRGIAPASAAMATPAMELLESIYRRYCDLIPLPDSDRAAVDSRCARRWLRMAHHAYHALRGASRSCWLQARRLDPHSTHLPSAHAILQKRRAAFDPARSLPLPDHREPRCTTAQSSISGASGSSGLTTAMVRRWIR
jgi:glycosyltransferase involved in cell wall biosynthesis